MDFKKLLQLQQLQQFQGILRMHLHQYLFEYLLLNLIMPQLQGALAALQLSTQAAQAQARAIELARIQAQIKMQSNTASNVAAHAKAPMPKPCETKPTLPTNAVSANVQPKFIDVQEESDWDEERSKNGDKQTTARESNNVFHQHLQQESGRFARDAPEKSTSDAKWKHDSYDPNQKTPPRSDDRKLVDESKGVSSSWLAYGTKTDDFDRPDPKATKNVSAQPPNDIPSRIAGEPPALTTEKQKDTVDFVVQKQQKLQRSLNPFLTVIEKPVKLKIIFTE